MLRRFSFAFQLALFCSCSIMISTAGADDWPNWRGPYGTGVATGSGYVENWGDDQNILWKVELPGVGGSTPAVSGDHIFLTCPSGLSESEKNLVMCFNLQGKKLWQKELGSERQGKHKKGSGSNPSPVTDGERVYCYFKSGDLVCLDFDGNIVWRHNLQKDFHEDTLWWDLGTSPVLTDDAVVVACVQSGPSYLVAYEKESGNLRWKQDRMTDAPEESTQTYSTPIVSGSGASQRLFVLGADCVTGHDANTGKQLWKVGGLNPKNDPYFRSISSPVLSGNTIVAPYARGGSLTGIRVGGSGDVTESHVEWSTKGPAADVPTPAVKDGVVYVLTDRGTVAALNPETGAEIWKGTLPKNRNAYSSSPVFVNGKLYIVREDGKAFVVKTDKFEVVAENDLDDRVVATPVFTQGRILLRAASQLYCIGK